MEQHLGVISPVTIGIDPGKDTGYAVYSVPERKLIEVISTDFWDAFTRVKLWTPERVAVVIVEVPSTKHVWHGEAANVKANQRMGLNVGMAIREGQLLADGLRKVGFNVRTVHPRGKVDSIKFKNFTGWTYRTNQHGRDAAMLCYGRSK